MSEAPYSLEAEEAVLGAVLTNVDAFTTVSAFLRPDDFFFIRHAQVWRAIHNLVDRKEDVDVLTVSKELQDMQVLKNVGGPAFLMQLINKTPTSAHAEIYGRIVERAAVRRRLLEVADEIKMLARDEQMPLDVVTSNVETRLFNVTDRQLKREFVPMSDAIDSYFDRIEYLMTTEQESYGVPMGFHDLDVLLGGLQRSDLLIFAGRPGMGKCVAEGTLIPTEHGVLPIEALKPKDVPGIPDDEGGIYYPLELDVQTPQGARTTAYFYDSGLKPTLRLTTRAGYSLTGTRQHPVWVYPGMWKSLDEIAPDDLVAVTTLQPIHATPTFTWDEVVAVDDGGLQQCFDLTVPEGQAFVANGIVSHNTSFLLTSAVNAARRGARVAIFTMEMGVEQLTQRMVAMETGIDMHRLRLGRLNSTEYSLLLEASGRISRLPIYIDDTPALDPIQMRTKCRRLQHERGIDLIILDYLQLMNAGGQYQNNRVQEISYISRALKELARELNVPLFSAAQLSRAVEQRQDKRPVLSDLRESGCLAGETRVYLADEGREVPIRDLVGKTGFRVSSVNTDTWQMEEGTVTNAFCTGVKPVYKLTTRSGRVIRATANHKFLTVRGWKRLDELGLDDHIAAPLDDTRIWDEMASIVPDGETEVYDLTVEPQHNFVAANIFVHNSLEQDADIVMFLYRDVVYNDATEFPNQADIIVAKHRNGPTGTVSLYFDKAVTKFLDGAVRRVDLGDE
ncbi:MAG: hypothetical protein OHK0046_28360 [Anaerolineae bacterium]